MKKYISKKTVGFYFLAFAGILELISLVRFLLWAPEHDGMDLWIIVTLAIGIILTVLVSVKDNDYLLIVITIMYSIPAIKLLTNSVGSFVDAFQGINMFGDATQVGTIISICTVMAVGILLCIISSFLKRQKEA